MYDKKKTKRRHHEVLSLVFIPRMELRNKKKIIIMSYGLIKYRGRVT